MNGTLANMEDDCCFSNGIITFNDMVGNTIYPFYNTFIQYNYPFN